MINLLKFAPAAVLMAVALPLCAQTATDGTNQDPPAAATDTPQNALDLTMGTEESTGPKPGDIYVLDNFTDWQIRCIKSDTPDATDACQLYQLLKDPNGHPVAEVNIFPLKASGGPVAGATVIAPLESFLPPQLGLSIDGGAVKKYPYSWCSTVGCFVRMGFAEEDIAAFKRGSKAALVIVPAVAPDQKVSLTVSLSGFTAAYDSAVARLAE